MAMKARRITLTPSSKRELEPYRVNTKDVTMYDTLIVRVDHEDAPGNDLFAFEFSGFEVAAKARIHFRAKSTYKGWEITWIEAKPKRVIDKTKE